MISSWSLFLPVYFQKYILLASIAQQGPSLEVLFAEKEETTLVTKCHSSVPAPKQEITTDILCQ